jgi:hypothetical protein
MIMNNQNGKQMKTYMTKYLITYWTQRNDESTDVELEVYAYNEIDAMKKILRYEYSL